jgi:hypothetical protein
VRLLDAARVGDMAGTAALGCEPDVAAVLTAPGEEALAVPDDGRDHHTARKRALNAARGGELLGFVVKAEVSPLIRHSALRSL